jgi:hypothetical protein
MRRRHAWCLIAGLLCAAPRSGAAQASHDYQTDVTAAELAARRAQICDATGPQAITLVQGAAMLSKMARIERTTYLRTLILDRATADPVQFHQTALTRSAPAALFARRWPCGCCCRTCPIGAGACAAVRPGVPNHANVESASARRLGRSVAQCVRRMVVYFTHRTRAT